MPNKEAEKDGGIHTSFHINKVFARLCTKSDPGLRCQQPHFLRPLIDAVLEVGALAVS